MRMIHVGTSLGPVSNLGTGRIRTPHGYVYLRDGLKHRDKGPAETHEDGYKAWFKMGRRHRVGGPAVIRPDGSEEYWQEGRLLKKSGPKSVTSSKRKDL